MSRHWKHSIKHEQNSIKTTPSMKKRKKTHAKLEFCSSTQCRLSDSSWKHVQSATPCSPNQLTKRNPQDILQKNTLTAHPSQPGQPVEVSQPQENTRKHMQYGAYMSKTLRKWILSNAYWKHRHKVRSIESSLNTPKTMEKCIKPKIDVESSRPSGIQIVKIDEIYDKTHIKPVSVYRCFYTKKHC